MKNNYIKSERMWNVCLTYVYRMFYVISILFTIGVGQMWGYDFTENKVVYLDNYNAQDGTEPLFGTSPYLRVGHSTYNSAYLMTKVPHTKNLYKYQIPSWGGYAAYAIANNCSWTGSNSIYLVDPDGTNYDITRSTVYVEANVSKDRTIWVTSHKNKDGNCDYYNIQNNEGLTKYTIGRSASNGTIQVKYASDGAGTLTNAAAAASGNVSVVRSGNLKIYPTASSGYALTALSVGSTSLNKDNKVTSADSDGDNNYYSFEGVRANATITATFTAIANKTIRIKDTDNWGGIKVYMWNDITGAKNADWPGVAATAYENSTKWYTVTLSTQYTHFIISKSGTPGTKSNDILISAAVDDRCYTTTTGDLPSPITCPSAPSVTTSAATSVAATSVKFNASGVGDNSDDITSYGFYWGTTSACSSGPIAASNLSSGTFSVTKSSLTNGTTYYFKAYATNGMGTTYGDPVSVRTKFITTVTLNQQGGSGGTEEVTATEGSAMPDSKTAPGKTGYTFGGYYASAGGSGKKYYNANMTSANNWDVAASTATIHAQWTVNTYKVSFSANGGAGDAMSNQNFTYDVAQELSTNTYTRTGYNFDGWATSAEGAKVYNDGQEVSNLTATNNATFPLFAHWTPKQSAITFDYQTEVTGYSSSGDITNATGLKGTYDADMTALAGTMPSAANGYAFMGFYDAVSGGGTKYYNANGSSAHVWDKDKESGTTLYAYYKKAEITGITFSTAGVPGSVIAPSTSTTATATISPTPTGTTTICWRILHSNGNPLEEQPTFDPETGAAVSFTTSATSGSYLIEARLRLGSGCNGTVLDSVTSVFQVAGDHNVTVQYKDASGNIIKASETVTGRPLVWTEAPGISAPEIFGYTFDHWKAGDGITLSENGTSALGSDESDEETIYIKAVYDGRLTAVYNQNKFLYLDLSQQFSESGYWSDPWVYFYNGGNPWDASNGVGAQDNGSYHSYYKEAHAMTQIGTSKIWYFDYSDVSSSNRSQYIAFTWGRHDGQKNFNATDVIFRGDFNEGTPLFVPITGQTATTVSNTSAKYYNAGYWVKYLGQQTGYTLEIYNEAGNSLLKSIAFANEGKRMPMIATADLEAGKTYKYQLKRDDGIYYGNNSTMNNTNHGQTTPWAFTNDPSFPGMCGLQTTAAGEYTFHLTYSNNGGSFNLRIAVDYPIAQGDYRLLYKDNVHKLWHPSAVIPSVKAKDTVSFFVRTGKAANLKLQKCTGLGDGTVTWSDTVTWWNGSTLPSAITKDSVYNICLKHNATTGKLEIENVEGYSGNYYIRTDAANNKWDNYKAADHMMTYSEYSEHNSDFSHYWMAHVTATSSNKFNVKYVVANDYSPCISDTLIQSTYRGGDSYHVDASGFISVEANIRFMWKRSTNEVYRAYLAPAQSDGSKFLVLRGQTDDNLRDVDGNYLRDASNNNHLGGDYCMQFVDNENWIYETTVKVIPSSYVKLFALFNTKNFYYKGANNDTFNGSDSGDTYHTPNAIQLITGSGEAQLVRVIYDFKTDRLVAAYLPSGNITEDMDINADVMFIREHQGDIDQLTFNSGKKLTDVKTAYGVIRFNKWTLNNKEKTGSHTPLASPLSRYERDLFYISFPFRVNLNEVFGFGTYGVHWILEYYDGAGRAEKGFWKDSPTFWKFVTNRNGFILEPNVGYLLALDLDQLGEESAVWNNRVENVELFFPSNGNIGSITSTSVTHNLPQHECTINRPTPQGDRRISDSHWNIMSVPTYVNVNNPSFTSSTWTTTTLGPKFLYTWNSDDNTLTPTTAAGFNYHAMHAYTVQYYGNVTWTASTTSPIVARKLQEPSAYEWCLELQQNDKMIDRTYVRMSDEEEVTTGFEFGYDMSKSIEWAKANIYTFIGTEWVAGNSLPLETEQTTIIPVGLTLAAAGDYTFAMPAGTHGVGVTLVDTQTNERTNLSAGMTQTVTLTQGDHLDRFFLEISPIHNAPTDIGLINGENGVNGAIGARKVLIDGILYIVKGDKLYDVRGTMIK